MCKSNRHTRILTLGILTLCGAAAWISGELVKQDADLWRLESHQSGLLARLCRTTESAGLGCKQASTSPWSRISVPVPVISADSGIGVRAANVPIAFVGLAYFVFLGVWFAFVGGPRPYGRGWHRLVLAVGVCGAAVSVFYVGLMALRADLRCIACLTVHAINLLLVLAMWQLYRGTKTLRPPDGFASFRPEQIARAVLTPHEVTNVLAFTLILIAGLWFYRQERIAIQGQINKLLPHKELVTFLQDDPEFLLREFYAQPRLAIASQQGESTAYGQPSLDLFIDFECPACYCKSKSVRNQIRDAFDGQLEVRIRHYPLSSDCNDNIETEFHANACDAAYAAEAARIMGSDNAFRQMYRLLYKNRKTLGDDIYRNLASSIGLDPGQFVQVMEGEDVRRIVQSDIVLANRLGVTGTPMIFLNGRRVTELCETPVFWEAVAQDPALWQEGLAMSFAGQSSSGMDRPHRPESEGPKP